ncbi:MAG: Murein DD-endopeptidase MepM [Pseudomonadota bacterium]|jgi:murein DD-endopeptidase MepM/ murein hydrolase activator NlpD
MQLMWLSGPTSQVKTISITALNVLRAACALAVGLIFLGFVLNWVGLRIAVEYNPDLARSLGGVTTELEQKRMEAVYREGLNELKSLLDQNVKEVKNLEAMKNRFMELATPVNLKGRFSAKDDFRGGPFVAPQFQSYFTGGFFRQPLQTDILQTAEQAKSVSESLASHEKKWTEHLNWLETLPIAAPIRSDFRLTSGFGLRHDPFSGSLAMHEGLDFAAEVGTKVVATGPGVVIRSDWDAGYGHVIEIKHAENFVTRYAHLSKRHVAENTRVDSGSLIGDVGSTGRSTGPHLHYEIFHQDRVLNPRQVMLDKAR